MTTFTTPPVDQLERWSHVIVALSGAALVIWALLRWPVTVLLKAALLAAVRATLADDEARATLGRLLCERLLTAELARLDDTASRVDALENPRRRRGA